MPVSRPRTRLVNFRVNDEEYAALVAACSQNGARSISDFARLAVLRRAGGGTRADKMQWRLAALGHKMTELEGRVQHLLRLLESTGNAAEADPPGRANAAC
jgi:hypothetical protein